MLVRKGLQMIAGVAVAGAALAADPWADAVVSYDAGVGDPGAFNDPATALGMPSRMTGTGQFAGPVTPFNAPYLTDQIVSVTAGGHLTVRFDEPIVDDAANPFGVDLLVFGNAFFTDTSFPNGIVGGMFADGVFTVSVSADGSAFVPLDGTFNDGLFPTLGYSDLTEPFPSALGDVPSDFTKPVDPSLTLDDLNGKSFAELLALYDGSGGGIPIDIASSGLSSVSYVRVDVPAGVASPEFDAFVAVPEPGTWMLLGLSLVLFRRR